MTIAELRDAYMLRLTAENRSLNTLRAYDAELRRFARFIGPDTRLEAIDRAMLRRYFARYQGTASTMQRRRVVLKCCLEEAMNLGQLSRNAADLFYTPKLRQRLPYCPSEAELLPALDRCYSPKFSTWPLRDKAILEVAYSTMARVDELRGMDVEHINWSKRTIRVTGKGDKQRLVLFGEEAELALRAYLRERELRLRKSGRKHTKALFVNLRLIHWSRGSPVFAAGGRMSARRLHSTIKAVCIGLGMSKKVHPHSLRRAGATHMLNRGCDLRTLKVLLGHEKLATTAKYARLAPERLRSVFENTHPDNAPAGV
jgi:integrase/recombinase XerC